MADVDYGWLMQRLKEVIDVGAFPGKNPKSSELPKRSPFQVLISTILSQRTKDANTHVASEALFRRYDTPEKLAEAPLDEIKELIRPAGFFNVKSERVKEVSGIIVKEHNGVVPDNMEELLSLPGVGRKTANCVLVYGFHKPAIPVDTHVHRISNRLGLVETKMPDDTERELAKSMPKVYWIEINRLMVEFGKKICRPRNPRCDICPITDICKYYREVYEDEDR